MVRLDLSYFYRLGVQLSAIRAIPPNGNIASVWILLFELRERMEQLVNDEALGSSLLGVGQAAKPLILHLNTLIEMNDHDEYGAYHRNRLMSLLNNLEIVLTNELSVSPAYFVSDKKPYSTRTLIAEGEALFPIDVSRKVPEAVSDLREAGKCIAFELSTAAAFHIHRAVECVLRRYWDVVCLGQSKPKQRSIGVYLAALKKHGLGDPKLIASLEQIKDLHRNAVIHPDESLDMPEAIALVGIANSVVSAMLKVLPFVPSTPPAPDDASFPMLADGADDEIAF